MAWVKLDDSMPMHPKLLAAGVDAFALDVAGIAYCNRYDTNGRISDVSLSAVLPNLENPELVAARLVEVGRWKRLKSGWKIHDYLEYQPSKEHKRDVSEKRAAAGKIGGSRSKREANGKQNASTDFNPVPSRPIEAKASTTFASFNHARAVAAVEERKRKGLPVTSPGGLARSIAKDPEHVQESQRIWAHRNCESCKGKGFTESYAPGAGQVRVNCQEPI